MASTERPRILLVPKDDHSGGQQPQSEHSAAPSNENDSRRKTPPGSPIHHSLWGVLRRAALRTCLRLSEASARGRSADELAGHVMPLGEAVWRIAQGESVVRDVSVSAVPASSILETLRSELLEELRSTGDKISLAEVVNLLRAIEILHERVSRDPAHSFSSRFLGSAGMDALVEVAHDMRSPLASIVLLVETMRKGQSGPVTAIQERQLGLAFSASFGLSLLANDLIALARGTDNLIDAQPMPFSIPDTLESVREIVLPMAEEKSIDLKIVLPEGDWRTGLPAALHRVLLNLVTNALKFTDSGYVEVGGRQTSRTSIQFYVRDTGKGIPPERLPTLFDAFRAKENHGPATFSSSGLGLATCRKLVARMGGELKVENCSDGGSRFHFEISLPPAARQ